MLVADARSRRAEVDPRAGPGRRFVLLLNRAAGGPQAGGVVRWLAGVRGAVALPSDRAAAAAVRAAPPLGAPAAGAAWATPPTGAPLGPAALPGAWRRPADELAMLLVAEWPSLGL